MVYDCMKCSEPFTVCYDLYNIFLFFRKSSYVLIFHCSELSCKKTAFNRRGRSDDGDDECLL